MWAARCGHVPWLVAGQGGPRVTGHHDRTQPESPQPLSLSGCCLCWARNEQRRPRTASAHGWVCGSSRSILSGGLRWYPRAPPAAAAQKPASVARALQTVLWCSVRHQYGHLPHQQNYPVVLLPCVSPLSILILGGRLRASARACNSVRARQVNKKQRPKVSGRVENRRTVMPTQVLLVKKGC